MTFSSAPLWYLTRSTGVIAFVLLTASVILGIAATERALASPRWPRWATQDLHRNLSVISILLMLVHALTTIADGFVEVSVLALLVPGASGYDRFAVALGTLALDALLLVAVTSFLRLRMPVRMWRSVHCSAYVAWVLSLAHFLMSGTDVKGAGWGLWLGLACAAAVVPAVAFRLRGRRRDTGPVRSVTGGTS